MADNILNLDQYQTAVIYKLESRGPGTYLKKLRISGNSILSSIHIQSMDPGASVKVNYWDTTTGTEDIDERYELDGHVLINSGDYPLPHTDRIIVTRVHNKPNAEVIVTGGNVEFGVYVTIVATFASDLDSALVKDGGLGDLVNDKAIPIACFNSNTGLYEFIRCPFPVTFEENGIPFQLNGESTTTPGTIQTLIDHTVPVGKTKRLQRLNLTTRLSGIFEVTLDGAKIGSGRTGAAQSNASFVWPPYQAANEGQQILVKHTQCQTGTPAIPIEAYLMGTEITN